MLRPTIPLCVLALLLAACQDGGGVRESTLPSIDTTNSTADSSTTSDPATTTTTQAAGTTTTTVSLQLGDELVFNGDFSGGTTGSLSGWELVSEDSAQTVDRVLESGEEHISFFSPLEEAIPWPEARSTVPFEVEPHTDYRLTVEARSVTEGRLFLALIFLDDDGDEILLRGPGSPAVSQSDWETFDATLESPADATSAYLVMRLAVRPDLSDADSFSVDVNNVSVREVVG